VEAEYQLEVCNVTFLPLGYDVNTAVYRVDTPAGIAYFLKLRKGRFDKITVTVPQFLSSLGIQLIIIPVKSRQGKLFGHLSNYTTILYPFIPGKDGYQVRLTDQQWVTLGRTLNMVHTAQLTPALATLIPHEVYDPQWRESVKRFMVQIENNPYDDPVANKLSAFLKAKQQQINSMLSRANALAEYLQQQAGGSVLCHSDAHPGNFLIADNGDLYLVDWDNPIFAPKERDLMFFGSGMSGSPYGGLEEGLFYQGYGSVEIDQKALAYYRYERIIQDIAEFCKQILLNRVGGEDRLQSYKYLARSFSPGHEVDAAFRTDQESGIR
jgi:spectinomycin phosphotransferase